jgi:hypothetical protein
LAEALLSALPDDAQHGPAAHRQGRKLSDAERLNMSYRAPTHSSTPSLTNSGLTLATTSSRIRRYVCDKFCDCMMGTWSAELLYSSRQLQCSEQQQDLLDLIAEGCRIYTTTQRGNDVTALYERGSGSAVAFCGRAGAGGVSPDPGATPVPLHGARRVCVHTNNSTACHIPISSLQAEPGHSCACTLLLPELGGHRMALVLPQSHALP